MENRGSTIPLPLAANNDIVEIMPIGFVSRVRWCTGNTLWIARYATWKRPLDLAV